MSETVKIILKEDGLYLFFQSLDAKKKCLEKMYRNNIDMFIDESELALYCYVRKYQHSNPTGQFISNEQRIGLAFQSEKQKFLFKETIGLSSEFFMDMGPGYDSQLHFNTDFFPYLVGASISTQMLLHSIEGVRT